MKNLGEMLTRRRDRKKNKDSPSSQASREELQHSGQGKELMAATSSQNPKASDQESPVHVAASGTPGPQDPQRSHQSVTHDLTQSQGGRTPSPLAAPPAETSFSTGHTEAVLPSTATVATLTPDNGVQVTPDQRSALPSITLIPATDLSAQESSISNRPPQSSSETGKNVLKSIGSYLLGGTKISLSALQAISALVPVPWLRSAVGAAIQVITVVEAVGKNI
ncbi:hypothetical protein FRB98_009527 [Tulasnella sp. 332]|nr:hypothetical protein FRB98_009527 [Tulasnella sp. 332]